MADIHAVNQALANNPKLASNPSAAQAVISSADPVATAPVISHSLNATTTQQVIQDNAAQGDNTNFWQKTFGGAAKIVMGGLNWLNKPLQEVQRDYRYIHSVYTNYGIFDGLVATGLVTGGAALGSFLGPGGTALGAGAAATLERKFLGHTIYDKALADSENPNYQVSAGRDFSHLLGQLPGLGTLQNTNKGLGKAVSGITDVASVFAMDPLVALGGIRTAVRSGDFLIDGKLIKSANLLKKMVSPQAVDNFFERNSLRMTSADQVQKLYEAGKSTNAADFAFGSAGKQYHRALDELATLASGENAVGSIVSKYPGLQNLANVMVTGEKVTAEDIHHVFMQTKWDQDFAAMHATAGIDAVPSRTVLRAAVSKVSDSLKQKGGVADDLYLRANQVGFLIPRMTHAATIGPDGVVTAAADKTLVTPVAYRAIKALNPFDSKARKELADGMISAVAGKVRTFSGYMPYEVGDDLKMISTKSFDPNGSSAPQIVYRVARYSMGERMARQKVSEFVAGDIGAKKIIWSGMNHEMIKAAGIIDDPQYLKNLTNKIQMSIDTPLEFGNYGVGHTLGTEASIAETATGKHLQGVAEHHVGRFAIPDFREIKLAMRQTNAYGALYGKLDNFAANYTDGIFKPLALLTGGFGIRIAASEIIPQIFRFGSVDVVKAKIAGAAQKMNYKLIAGEDDAIAHNAALALSGGTMPKASDWIKAQQKVEGAKVRKVIAAAIGKAGTESDMELAAKIAMATKGHMATGATLTGKGVYGDTREQLEQIINVYAQAGKKTKLAPTGDWISYISGDSQFPVHYATQLKLASNSVSQRQMASELYDLVKNGTPSDKAILIVEKKELARILKKEYDPASPTGIGKNLPAGQDLYSRERKVLAGYGNEDPAAFAHRKADIVHGLFAGPNGEINMDILGKVVKGEKVTVDEIRNTPINLKPMAVAGEKFDPVIGENLLSKIINNGFEKVIDPIINNLSRQTLFFNHVKNELASMDSPVAKGFFTEDEALRLAMTRATNAMLPQIHNVALRTQFGVLTRNFLPFYFAQEQAMRRAGTLITTNPAAFRQYQLYQQGLNNPGFVETDSLGQKHINIPIVGELGASVINAMATMGMPVVGGLPITATGNLESLRTVLPEFSMPGVSPFASIALNSLAQIDPGLDRYIKGVVGGAGFNRSLMDQLIPNSPMRNAFKALSANEQESSFYNAMIASLASAQYHGQMPSPDSSPVEKQAFLDRIKNNARSILWVKALTSIWSPLSPAITQEDLGLRDEFYSLLKQKSQVTGQNMSFAEALGTFLAKHGNSAISYTVGKTEAAVPGAMMPYTTEAINWIENNKALLNSKNATGAAFLIPQVTSLGGDAQAIHDEIIKMHLRSNKTPQEFMNAVYISAGNNYIYSQKPAHDKAMAELKAAGQSQVDERAAWSDFTKNYGVMNPIWEADYSSPVRTQNAVHAVEQLQNLFSSTNPPKGQQADLVAGLLRDWVTHAQTLQSYNSSFGQGAVNEEKDNWSKYLDTIAQKEPRLNSVINSVFRRLA